MSEDFGVTSWGHSWTWFSLMSFAKAIFPLSHMDGGGTGEGESHLLCFLFRGISLSPRAQTDTVSLWVSSLAWYLLTV